jgi:hypothetical protein
LQRRFRDFGRSITVLSLRPVPTIVEQGYVLVLDATNRVSGIITTFDLSVQFQQLAEPFLLRGKIENHVHRLIDGKLTKEELAEARDPSDTERQDRSIVSRTSHLASTSDCTRSRRDGRRSA